MTVKQFLFGFGLVFILLPLVCRGCEVIIYEGLHGYENRIILDSLKKENLKLDNELKLLKLKSLSEEQQ